MTYKTKLIEVALPLDAINRESAREKSIRHGHPSTLHLWWARRPLGAARAVLWASLVDDPTAHPEQFPTVDAQETERQRLFRILEELVKWENSSNERVLEAARAEIVASCDGNLPNILDPFCGGGTIPLEAQRLGLPAYGGDLNPVAVLITKAMVEIPPRFAGMPPVNPSARVGSGLQTWERAQGMAEDIRSYGQWMRDRAFERIGHLYPKVRLSPDKGGAEATVIAWIWARTVESPDPSWQGHVPLVRSWVLRAAAENKPVVWIEPIIERTTQTITYRIREGGKPIEGTVHRAQGVCLATGTPITDEYIKAQAVSGAMAEVAIAVVAEGNGGRAYVAPEGTVPKVARPIGAPSIKLSTHPQYMGPPRYGLETTDALFGNRQLTALMTFSDLLGEVRADIEEHAQEAGLSADRVPLHDGGAGATAYADAVTTYLAFGIDRLADRQSTICSWDNGYVKIRNTFARQAIPMTWDFAEGNPFSDSTGNWLGMIDWIRKVVEDLPASASGDVVQRDAAARIGDVPKALISTDPPYYDNVPYADISDFFYSWLRMNLRDVWPDELSTLAVPKAEELVADAQRHGGRDAAKKFFEKGMSSVLKSAAACQDQRFPMIVFYAFKQMEGQGGESSSTGWETFLQGLLDSGLAVLRTWPARTELANRPRAFKSGALASSIVLVCRPRSHDAPMATRSEFLAALRSELPEAIRLLQRESIAPVDMAQSAIGPGMAVFSRYSKVIDADGKAMRVKPALVLINEVLEEVLSEEETEFDGDTRWALTWFEQYGLNPGPYGVAETLSKAKNTSVTGVIHAGIAKQRDGKVRLVERDELTSDWDPAADSRLTVWELTQNLIARLGESESAAAGLLRKVGSGIGERSRQLAYLLYQVAERRGWAEEAVAYNTLVQAWPDLVKLSGRSETPVQQRLGE